MSYSSSTTTSTSVAYEFKYFPRYGRWTKEMQAELDEHSRRMAKLMMHVQDLHKPRKIEDEQKEDTDADCVGSPMPSTGSSPVNSPATSPGFSSGSIPPVSPPEIQESVYFHSTSPGFSSQETSPWTHSGFSSGFSSPSTSPQLIGGTVYYPSHYAPSPSSGSSSPSMSPPPTQGTVYFHPAPAHYPPVSRCPQGFPTQYTTYYY